MKRSHIVCLVSGRRLVATPEERVRQTILSDLLHVHGYRKEDLSVELRVAMGSSNRRADIAIFPAINFPTYRWILHSIWVNVKISINKFIVA